MSKATQLIDKLIEGAIPLKLNSLIGHFEKQGWLGSQVRHGRGIDLTFPAFRDAKNFTQ